MNKPRIVAVHLLNDFSGSPFVLRQALEALVKINYPVELFTATPGPQGFLTDIDGVKENRIFYKWNKNKLVTLFLFLWSQLSLFGKLFFRLKKNDIVYINSLLPFGAALAAWLRGCKVLYHIHEVSIKPALLKNFLLQVSRITASKAIFVSQDLMNRTRFNKPSGVIYNALPDDFVQTALLHTAKKENDRFTVLMLCSMKAYKGVFEFAECAGRLPVFDFNLVLNASQPQIDEFFREVKLPANLHIFPAQKNVHPFYQQADVVMNLSKPAEWIETFGMTVLEAMYYKKPVIVPPVGGVAELVCEDVEGYLVDSSDINALCDKLRLLATCPSLYQKLSVRSFKKAHSFSQGRFSQNIQHSIDELCAENQGNKTAFAVQATLF
jgi:L-malate glycosyltransferase